MSEHGLGRQPATLIGLILEVVPDETKTYQKIGIFEYSHGIGTSDDDPAMFPECTDFDVDDFGQGAITII
jgi:hypothetical protein